MVGGRCSTFLGVSEKSDSRTEKHSQAVVPINGCLARVTLLLGATAGCVYVLPSLASSQLSEVE